MSDHLEFSSDDELLSAHLDGMLPQAQRVELERRLEHEPALAERLAQLQRADTTVHDAYAPVLDEPLPQAVLDLLGATEAGAEATPGVVDLAAHRQARMAAAPGWQLALAASFTLAIGVGLGYFAGGRGGVDGGSGLDLLASAGVIEPGSGLHAALESGTSGAIVDIGRELRAMPILSFIAQDGEVCRQIELGDAQTSAEALACRRNGSWQLDALGFLPGQPFAGNAGGFRPAGSAGNAIDALVDQRIAGDPLDVTSEQALIENNWRR